MIAQQRTVRRYGDNSTHSLTSRSVRGDVTLCGLRMIGVEGRDGSTRLPDCQACLDFLRRHGYRG